MISDEDVTEILRALRNNGFSEPYMARISVYGREGIAAADAEAEAANRQALRDALESTEAWKRNRIY